MVSGSPQSGVLENHAVDTNYRGLRMALCFILPDVIGILGFKLNFVFGILTK